MFLFIILFLHMEDSSSSNTPVASTGGQKFEMHYFRKKMSYLQRLHYLIHIWRKIGKV
jgi:hypothetical protein